VAASQNLCQTRSRRQSHSALHHLTLTVQNYPSASMARRVTGTRHEGR
jgi:hypothetical protein